MASRLEQLEAIVEAYLGGTRPSVEDVAQRLSLLHYRPIEVGLVLRRVFGLSAPEAVHFAKVWMATINPTSVTTGADVSPYLKTSWAKSPPARRALREHAALRVRRRELVAEARP